MARGQTFVRDAAKPGKERPREVESVASAEPAKSREDLHKQRMDDLRMARRRS